MTLALDLKSAIEQRLDSLVPNRPESLYQAARYSLLSPGKRLRPLLVLQTASSLGGDPMAALDAACAVEMIHAYSLIHDDLPCMDDDDLRRGRPTLHKVYGEAIALLAGDTLLTFAFETLASCPLSASQKIAMIRILANQGGAEGMIGGQAVDIESEGKAISEDLLLKMHRGKTASLLKACLALGSIAANAPEPVRFQLESIGEDLGLAYQLQDDLLNATSTTAILGKKAGSDQAKQKATAVSLFGSEWTQNRIATLQDSLVQRLTSIPFSNAELLSTFEVIFKRKF